MYGESRDALHVKKLLQIKLRNNQYLPRNNLPQHKLNKSKSQLSNLSSQIIANRKNIKSVNKELHKPRPVDYYSDKGKKYLYEQEVENVQKLLINRLQKKNDKLEEKYQKLKKKMIKIPLYKLNGMRNTKRTSLIKLFSNDGDTKEENKDYYKHKEYNED